MSLGEGWRNAGQSVRRAAARVHEQFDRTPEGAEALDSAMHPELYGATEDIQMANMVVDEETLRERNQTQFQVAVSTEAERLVQHMGLGEGNLRRRETTHNLSNKPPPGGVLSQLLKNYAAHPAHSSKSSISTTASDTDTPAPKKKPKTKCEPPKPPLSEKKKKHKRKSTKVQLTVHIAAILTRQQYIMRLCRALMAYGAPTHRLEEYMQMTANVLEVNGQFLYLPGCMIMSFDDPLTHTAEVKLIRTIQGLDLGRLAETHNIYKNVVHDLVDVEQSIQDLDALLKRDRRYKQKWLLVLLSGLASVAVGPWAFDARPIDMPIIFILGCILGVMQHVVAPRSALYSNVLEVSIAMLNSFLARGFGSIRVNGETVFCFPAMAQSSIALILPGFSVLCSSLELQSHQIIAGSIRLVYTIIYSLFLGYGVTVGTVIYGLLDRGATKESKCSQDSLKVYGNEYIQHFIFVAVYCFFAAVINQAKWKQIPMMVTMGTAGYVTNYFSTKKLGSTSPVANTVGAFTIGLFANLYSRLWHGHAAAAIIPGMFTLVSSGLASSGSIMSGLSYAEAVRNNTVNDDTSTTSVQNSLTGLGYTMIQTSIGITVGLFIAALIVYPRGKQRSGLFNL
ncbi:hypothetical protein ASPWEDRAFT_118499 [Aspergillus wentii DTO 134E9]|uniref:Threonine/serine exporter-like N-terminal domain-containing protein n=1 Tax=Aspergillus wentii DTO 134E9 TaxID=1073089 RepID=A0A1L9R8M3_ASPWE|nr:uncharacterized protein ASPWEDRAFT_118499 [Aspergillus wentii DTO 134E9]OJJ31275.1 hypothetical protein ASPWEDRAFT_118499 [Aspergillus wentii DTO 134E9]